MSPLTILYLRRVSNIYNQPPISPALQSPCAATTTVISGSKRGSHQLSQWYTFDSEPIIPTDVVVHFRSSANNKSHNQANDTPTCGRWSHRGLENVGPKHPPLRSSIWFTALSATHKVTIGTVTGPKNSPTGVPPFLASSYLNVARRNGLGRLTLAPPLLQQMLLFLLNLVI